VSNGNIHYFWDLERGFAPDDFDLVISDESHRRIGGNCRAVFED
jgi:type I site-specific restriction endonuclease